MNGQISIIILKSNFKTSIKRDKHMKRNLITTLMYQAFRIAKKISERQQIIIKSWTFTIIFYIRRAEGVQMYIYSDGSMYSK